MKTKRTIKRKGVTDITGLPDLGESMVLGERIMPTDLRSSPENLRTRYQLPGNLRACFEKARQMESSLQGNWYVRQMLRLKKAIFARGFRVVGASAELRKWLEDSGAMAVMERLAADTFHEYLLQDNAVVTWFADRRASNGMPQPQVEDSERIAKYEVLMGRERLHLRVDAVGGMDQTVDTAGLAEKWVKALQMGGEVEMDRSIGEHFEVLKAGKMANGLTVPSLGLALALFATLEYLQRADNIGSFEHRNLIRHITKGHEIKQGPKAGDDAHFLNKTQKQKLVQELKGKSGAYDLISNFDLGIAWAYLDPKFFDPQKYKGVMELLRIWSGAVMELQDENPSSFVLTQLRSERDSARDAVAMMLERVFNHPEFFADRPVPGRIRVAWDPWTHLDAKFLLETLRYGTSIGLVSPQTARAALGVDDVLEVERLAAAAANPVGHRPVFEAAQGMLEGRNGRPVEAPGDE